MARIIPWKLPDVEGGSVGGYTPAPTPEPLTNYPYDFDNLDVDLDFELITKYQHPNFWTSLSAKLDLSGVVILDTSEVASVIATVECSHGNAVYDVNGSNVTATRSDYLDFTVDVSSIMTNLGGTVYGGDGSDFNGKTSLAQLTISQSGYGTLVSTTCTLKLVKITVYNGNGVALQEWTPPEE